MGFYYKASEALKGLKYA